MNVDIGFESKKREQIAQGLSKVLADSYTLYLTATRYTFRSKRALPASRSSAGAQGPTRGI